MANLYRSSNKVESIVRHGVSTFEGIPFARNVFKIFGDDGFHVRSMLGPVRRSEAAQVTFVVIQSSCIAILMPIVLLIMRP